MGIKKIEDIIKTPRETIAVRSELIMTMHCNMLHSLFGGNFLQWMDIVAEVSAQKFCGMDCVTASIDGVSFKHAVHNGDIITLEAKVTRAFTTSIEVYVKAMSGKPPNIYDIITHEGYCTFVAIDKDSRPARVPQLIPETAEEKEMFEQALFRRELRGLQTKKTRLEDSPEVKKYFQKLIDEKPA